MRLSRVLLRHGFRGSFVEKWERRLNSKYGNLFFVSLVAPMVAYPLTAVLLFGPFIGMTFKLRYDVDDKLPQHLQKLITEVCSLNVVSELCFNLRNI
jgi:hypothetical protein